MDEKLVEYAMDKFGDTVLRVAASVTGNRTDADDVFCDVFFALYKQYGFSSDNHLKAWLIRVTANMAKNVRKAARRQRRAELNESVEAPETESGNETLDALQRLKPKERAVIYLHYYEGYVFGEIAGMLGVREGSVRSIAARARESLREMLL